MTLRDDLSTAIRERDEARVELASDHALLTTTAATITSLKARAEAAEALVSKLREGLQPFASVGIGEGIRDGSVVTLRVAQDTGYSMVMVIWSDKETLRVRDFRHARALTQPNPAHAEETTE